MKKPIFWFLFLFLVVSFENITNATESICSDTINLNTTITIESCLGNDGQIELLISGGDAPFTFINNGLIGIVDTSYLNFDSLNSGTYNIIVSDVNNCADTVIVSLSSDTISQIQINVESTNIVCYGDDNGTFKVVEPDSNYIYELYSYNFSVPQLLIDTGFYFNGLQEGYYGVIAISSSGECIDSSIVLYIQEPTQITFSSPITEPDYCDDNTCEGVIVISENITGGIAPYQYNIYPLFFSSSSSYTVINDTVQSVCPGVYEIQVLDANACVVKDTVHVEDLSLVVDSFIFQHISCFGASNGEAMVFASGGKTGVYTYSWDNGDLSQQSTNLSSGYANVIVADSSGCLVVDSIYISQPEMFTFKVIENSKVPETCKGFSNDGQVTLNISGGTSPYYSIWQSSGGYTDTVNSNTIVNLSADTITFFVLDTNSCLGTPEFLGANQTVIGSLNYLSEVKLDTSLMPSYSICYGSSSGEIEIFTLSGQPPFQYSIDNGNTLFYNNTFYNLPSQNYNIIVYDVFGCSDSTQILISEFPEIEINVDSLKNISCFEGSDGFIKVDVSGGVGNYSYLWNPGSFNNNYINNLTSQTYSLQVTDSLGCVSFDMYQLYDLYDPLQIFTQVDNPTCYGGSDGSALVNVSGGLSNSNGQYNFTWTSSTNVISNSFFATDLTAGTYLVSISDSLGCGQILDSVVITQPDFFNVEILSVTNNICFDGDSGTLVVNAEGGVEPYLTYYASDFSNNSYSQNLNIFNNLKSSNYSVWVIDTLGCSSDTLLNVKIGEPGKINIDINIINPSCHASLDGVLDLSFSSGLPLYQYQLLKSFEIISTGYSNLNEEIHLSNLASGSYSLVVNDLNNCSVDSFFEINSPQEIVSLFETGVTLGREALTTSFVNLSTGADIFYWDYDDGVFQTSFQNEEVVHTFANQGDYDVMLVASNSNLDSSCSDTSFVTIGVEGYDKYNVFSPNHDGINDFFHFNDWMLQGLYVEIFNKWGQKVFSWSKPNGFWAGEGFNGERLPEGVYFYIMDAIGFDGYNFTEKGSVILVR